MKLELEKTLLCAMMLFSVVFSHQLAAQFGGPTRPVVDLPEEEPIRSVILRNCSSCHGIDDYAFHAMDRTEWQALLDAVHKRQRNVKISGRDEAILLDYLVQNFGPDSIAFPRDYVAQEITEFFSNDDGRVFLEQKCTSCHGVDRVLETRHNLEGWRSTLVAERERGANLEDEELEQLAEWLSRVRGVNPFE